MEFEKIKDDMGLVDVNTTAAREHVAEIERGICLIKEECQSVVKSLLFWYMHRKIVTFVVYFVTMFVDAVPAAEGISGVFSPCDIVTQQETDSKKDCKAQFGWYMEASTDAVVRNDMKSRISVLPDQKDTKEDTETMILKSLVDDPMVVQRWK